MGNEPLSAREALIAQLLQEVDETVSRVEGLRETIGPAVERAVAEAANSAFAKWKMGFEGLVREQAGAISESGRYAAARVGNELDGASERAVAAAVALGGATRKVVVLVVGACLLSGLVGGVVGGVAALHLAR